MTAFLRWTLVLPLTVVSSQVAHWAAYRVVAPDARQRAQLLADSGHGYLVHVGPPLAVCLALVLAAVAVRAYAAALGRARAHVGALPFALLPPVYFVVQECLERAAVGEGPATWVTWTLALGILLHVPIGLIAFAAARLLERLADEVGSRHLARPRPCLRRRRNDVVRPPAALLPRLAVLASGGPARAPPFPV